VNLHASLFLCSMPCSIACNIALAARTLNSLLPLVIAKDNDFKPMESDVLVWDSHEVNSIIESWLLGLWRSHGFSLLCCSCSRRFALPILCLMRVAPPLL